MLVVPAVFGLAILEIWAAVPTGIALGVPPLAVWLLTVTGSLVGVAVVALGGASLRAWLGRRRGNLTVSRSGRLYRVWLRYGVPGWGLLSPLVLAPAMALPLKNHWKVRPEPVALMVKVWLAPGGTVMFVAWVTITG